MNLDNSSLFCVDLLCQPRPEIGTILVAGATGYAGGRLLPELLARGYRVRVMARAFSPECQERWPEAETIVADALNPQSLSQALEGIHTAYYLIHSMLLGKKHFESADIQAAINFRKAAEEKNVKRIIYLGGLGDRQESLSPHLRSRMRVAAELQAGKIPVTILRAAVIIGSGSASYEIIKHLAKKVPLFVAPRWVRTRYQPIGIRDVVKYLVGVMEIAETEGKSFDIGGPDILTYETMLKIQAELFHKKPLFIPSPLSHMGLYAYLTSLLTPVPAPIIRSLMAGSRNEVICQNDDIKKFLTFLPIGYKEALIRAMSREEQDKIHSRWSDAYPPAHELALKLHELKTRPRYTAHYAITTAKSAAALYHSICRIGGKEGWFHSNWMWRLRGMIDKLFSGIGTARGRRSSSTLRLNDVLDFWRVENLKKDEFLLLRAEMKLPGKAWLEFKIEIQKEKNLLAVNAYFQTSTVLGKLYWYFFLPFHYYIFYNLIKEIEKRS